jgi:hypothetical protein
MGGREAAGAEQLDCHSVGRGCWCRVAVRWEVGSASALLLGEVRAP